MSEATSVHPSTTAPKSHRRHDTHISPHRSHGFHAGRSGLLRQTAVVRYAGQVTTTFTVPGLSASVEILVDRWGVPHVYAESQDDVFVAQGFNAARDRLFQIDLWRRRGLGLLSEVFGAAYVERDRAARLFLYRGDMAAEWRAYGSDTKRVTNAFVQGV